MAQIGKRMEEGKESIHYCEFEITVKGKILSLGMGGKDAAQYCKQWLKPKSFESCLGAKEVSVEIIEIKDGIPVKEDKEE